MIGQFFTLPSYQGELYTTDAGTFALLNGQVLSRASFAVLSPVWVSGMYGSTDTEIVLPDFTDSYLRAQDLGANIDPDVNTRISISGILPSGNSPGSYQFGSCLAHQHTGTYTLYEHRRRDEDNDRNYAAGTTLEVTNLQLQGPSTAWTVATPSGDGTVDETLFEPAHFFAYPYLQVG